MIYLDYSANTPVTRPCWNASVQWSAAAPATRTPAIRPVPPPKPPSTRHAEHCPQPSCAAGGDHLYIRCQRGQQFCVEEHRPAGAPPWQTHHFHPAGHSSVSGTLTALQEQGYEIDLVDIKQDGTVDLAHLRELLRPDTILVAVTAVDSELGVVQPVTEIAALLKDYPTATCM